MTDEVSETSANLSSTRPSRPMAPKSSTPRGATHLRSQMMEALLHADEYYKRNGLYQSIIDQAKTGVVNDETGEH